MAAKRRQKQSLLAAVASLLTAAAAATVDPSQVLDGMGGGAAAAAGTAAGKASRLRLSAEQPAQPDGGAATAAAARLKRKDAAHPLVGKDNIFDALTKLVFAGTDLSPEERKLGNEKSAINDVFSERELTEFYWRQLSVSYAPAPAPKKEEPEPEPEPESRSIDTTITCPIDESIGGDDSSSSASGTSDSTGSGSDTNTVVVTFTYNVEGIGYMGKDVSDVLEYTILEEIADEHCKGGRRRHLRDEDGYGNGGSAATSASATAAWTTSRRGLPDVLSVGSEQNLRHRQTAASPDDRAKGQRRKLEIVSISSDPEDKRTDANCQKTDATAQNCATYEGAIEVTYTTEGDNSVEEDVVANTRRTIMAGMESGTYVDTMNGPGLWDNVFEVGSRQILKLVYVGPDPDEAVVFATLQEVPAETTTSSSSGKKIGIALGLFAAFIIAAAFLIVRRRRNRSTEEEVTKDEVSLHTDLDNSDDLSYATADYNNLGKRSTKNDVHECQSSLCRMCGGNGSGSFVPSEILSSADDGNALGSPSAYDSGGIIQELAKRRDRDVVFVRTDDIPAATNSSGDRQAAVSHDDYDEYGSESDEEGVIL